MQLHKEAEMAVAEGWVQRRGPGGAFHPTSRLVLCHCAWLFHTQNTSASVIKDAGKTRVNNFLAADLSGFYLLLFTPCEM